MKLILSSPRIKSSIPWFFLILILVFLFFDLIKSDIFLSHDDHLLFTPITKIHSLKEYFNGINNGLIADIQPIRDFSYFIDFKLLSLTSWHSLHFTNFFLWGLIVIGVYHFFTYFIYSTLICTILTFLYALSPINLSSVAWIAGRKHLLSTLFIVWASNFAIKAIRKNSTIPLILSILFYGASCLSQPINVLFPVWIILFIFLEKRQKLIFSPHHKIALAFLSIIAILVLVINIYYYQIIYPQFSSGFSKFISTDSSSALTALALGRYLSLCLNPFGALPVSHYPGEISNMVGLILLPLFFYICYKKTPKDNKNNFFIGTLLFFYPLLIVTIKPTNIFCSDTYLLNASLGIFLILGNIIQILSRFQKTFVVFSIIMITGLIFFDARYLEIYLDETSYWQYVYDHENSPYASVKLAERYTGLAKFEEAQQLLDAALTWAPSTFGLKKNFAFNIYKNTKISKYEKIHKLNSLAWSSPTKSLLLAHLYAQEGDKEKCLNSLKGVFESKPNFNLELSHIKEFSIAYSVFTCDFFKDSECSSKYLNYKNIFQLKNWDQNLFDEQLLFLKRVGFNFEQDF